jgi:hypothetical protein
MGEHAYSLIDISTDVPDEVAQAVTAIEGVTRARVLRK